MHLRVNQCKELDKTKVTDNIKTLNVPGYCCWHLRCCQVMHMIFTRYGRDGTNAFDEFWFSYPCCNYQKSSIWEKLSTVALCTQSSPRAMYFLRVVSFSFFSLADFIRPYANTAITIQAGITFFTQLYSLNITFLSAKHETAAVNSLFKVNRIVTMEGGEYIHALRLYRSKIPVRTPLSTFAWGRKRGESGSTSSYTAKPSGDTHRIYSNSASAKEKEIDNLSWCVWF